MKRKKIKVYVLTGGPSAEHEVSLETGKKIIASLDSRKFEIRPVLVSRQGKWLVTKQPAGLLFGTGPRFSPAENRGLDPRRMTPTSVGDQAHAPAGHSSNQASRLAKNMKGANRIAFIAMHGSYGEDGTIQGMLELAGMPYTGSGILASALAMDKVKSAEIFRAHGILTPKFVAFEKSDWKKHRSAVKKQIGRLSYPLIMKPRDQGSSVGVSIVKSAAQLEKAVGIAFKYSNRAMAQQYIRGKEVTCAVIDRGVPLSAIALQPTEIIPKNSALFDYRAKYTPGASQEITPPHLPKSVIKKIQRTALAAHTALGCSGMSRTDMILENPKSKVQSPKLYVLEVNTIPGMTETSLLPQAAKACGIEFPELLERIIEAGFNRFARG